MPGRIEKVVVDRISIDLIVLRSVKMRIDCGCFRHVPREFEVIITRGGAYIRDNGEHAFRPIAMHDPITVSIEECKLYEQE